MWQILPISLNYLAQGEGQGGGGGSVPSPDRATLEGQSTAASGPARPCHRLWGSGYSYKSSFFDNFFVMKR